MNCTICNGVLEREVLRITVPDRFEKSVQISDLGYLRVWSACRFCGALSNLIPEIAMEKIELLRKNYYEIDFSGSDINQKYQYVMTLPTVASDNFARIHRVLNFCKDWFSAPDKSSLSFLDIGAGTGVFLSKLLDLTSASGFRYLAIEPDPMAAKHLRNLRKFEVFEGIYEGQSFFNEFNVITMNKVLEHIQEPMKLLEKISKSMRGRNKVLYLEVPDRVTAEIASQGDNILGVLHCHLYDLRTFTYMAEELNLEILTMERIKEPSGKFTIFAFLTSHENLIGKWSCHDI
jgi:2-polyprenyl-3-methyl-5-hydroxy-6-metoxy-1,4-benzoquinol methylase